MIFTVFKKELIDTLRDKRTIRAMLLVPLLVFPIIFGLMTYIQGYIEDSDAQKSYDVLVIGDMDKELMKIIDDMPEGFGSNNIIYAADTTGLMSAIRNDSIKVAFEYFVNENEKNSLLVYFKGADVNVSGRVKNYTDYIKNTLKNKSLAELGIVEEDLIPINVVSNSISTPKEMVGKLLGGFLPYIFVIFGFIGCMYPAIDLFTGERERKTLETLLTAPVQRWKILIGKMLVIVLSGITAAVFGILGIYLSIEVFGVVEDTQLMDTINDILSVSFVISLLILLIPLTFFFAGMMIPITIRAKSFKEAQSLLTPLNFIVILPAIIGLIPTVELNYGTAFIPIVNIVLSAKELIAGTQNFGLILISFTVMLLLAFASVLFSYKRFGNENNVID